MNIEVAGVPTHLPSLRVVVVLLHLLVPAVHSVLALDLNLGGRGPAGVDVLPKVAVRPVLELVVVQQVVRPGLSQLTQLARELPGLQL